MFNSTHTFVGLLIGKTGTEKWAPYGLATAVIASNLPDIDSIAGLWGTATYLDHHRGITHSLIGIPVLAFLLSAIIYFFSGNFGKTYAIALIAMATHPALDYLNPYGVRPFLPWNTKWYYGDLVFIFDPYLDLILVMGLIAGRFWPRRLRIAAFGSFVVAAGYIVFRIQLHGLALSEAPKVIPPVSGVQPQAALPSMIDPRDWTVLFESESELLKVDFNVSRQSANASFSQLERGSWSRVVEVASMAPTAAAILRFARFPITRVYRIGTGYRVIFFDYRFYRAADATALAAEVLLDESLRVTRDRLSFVEPVLAK